MTDVPYGYRMQEGKLEIEPNEAAIVRHIYEVNEFYSEKPPIWGKAVVNGSSICIDDTAVCSVSDFVRGYIAAEVNCLQQLFNERRKEVPEIIMSEFLEEEGTKARVRQCLMSNDIKDFCDGICAELLGDIQCNDENAGEAIIQSM